MDSYKQFISAKLSRDFAHGFNCDSEYPFLFPFQMAVVRWATRIGRCGIFADTGLGKTRMQLAWADQVIRKTDGSVLIVAPLSVAEQTVHEGNSIGIEVRHIKKGEPIDGLCITNYERLHRFDTSQIDGVILDESSIIKHHTSKSFALLTDRFRFVPFKLCATATPAPNDYTEIGTHAEFLGVCNRAEMLSEFFIHDAAKTQDWRLKGHAKHLFWQWLASWGAIIRHPSDLGFNGAAYDLPELKIIQHVVESNDNILHGNLFEVEASTLMDRRRARRDSIDERVSLCSDMVNESSDNWVVWCELNDESEKLANSIPDSIEVRGSDSLEKKEKSLEMFRTGQRRVIVTKPSIAGFGLNWQHCHKMAFVGVTDSFESYYQAIRRCWRFGQSRPVDVHVISSSQEGAVVSNLRKKQELADELSKQMAMHTADAVRSELTFGHEDKALYSADKPIRLPEFL